MAVFPCLFFNMSTPCPPPSLTDRVGGVTLKITTPLARLSPSPLTGPAGRRVGFDNCSATLERLPWNGSHSTPLPRTSPFRHNSSGISTIYHIHHLPCLSFNRHFSNVMFWNGISWNGLFSNVMFWNVMFWNVMFKNVMFKRQTAGGEPFQGNSIKELFQESHFKGNRSKGNRSKGNRSKGNRSKGNRSKGNRSKGNRSKE